MISQYSTVASGILLGVVLQKLEGYKQNRKKQDTVRINKFIIPTMEHVNKFWNVKHYASFNQVFKV